MWIFTHRGKSRWAYRSYRNINGVPLIASHFSGWLSAALSLKKMKKDKNSENIDKTFAAVCGLYCKAFSWYIATTEEPERLAKLAKQMNFSEEESKCYGCRSDKRLPYCQNCEIFICAYERKIDFCSKCDEYPCDTLKNFSQPCLIGLNYLTIWIKSEPSAINNGWIILKQNIPVQSATLQIQPTIWNAENAGLNLVVIMLPNINDKWKSI